MRNSSVFGSSRVLSSPRSISPPALTQEITFAVWVPCRFVVALLVWVTLGSAKVGGIGVVVAVWLIVVRFWSSVLLGSGLVCAV